MHSIPHEQGKDFLIHATPPVQRMVISMTWHGFATKFRPSNHHNHCHCYNEEYKQKVEWTRTINMKCKKE